MQLYKYCVIAGMALAFACASCKVTSPYKSPALPPAALYRDSAQQDTTNIANLPWRRLFPDTTLQSLIGEGLANNLDLKTAIQRMAEAAATLQQTKAAFYPGVSANAGVTKARLSDAAQSFKGLLLNTTTYQAGLSASWEADIWGKLKSNKKIAIANFLKSDAARRAVQTQLIADIATNYFSLLALDRQLAITRATLKNRENDVTTMKDLMENAVVNGAAVVQSEANRYAAEVSIPDLETSIAQTENALSTLLARTPGPIARGSLDQQQQTFDLKTGVPSQLLQNRPDVQQAQYAFMSAFENTNLAKTYFYPSFSITASAGISSITIKNLFSNSIFYSVAAGLTQPIFNQGQNKARLTIAKAQQQEALNDFQQTMLTAGKEVSNALISYQAAIRKQTSREKEISFLQQSVDFTRQLLEYSSSTNYTDVLTSEQNLLTAQLSGVSDRLQQLQAVVSLYRALGGGWK